MEGCPLEIRDIRPLFQTWHCADRGMLLGAGVTGTEGAPCDDDAVSGVEDGVECGMCGLCLGR